MGNGGWGDAEDIVPLQDSVTLRKLEDWCFSLDTMGGGAELWVYDIVTK